MSIGPIPMLSSTVRAAFGLVLLSTPSAIFAQGLEYAPGTTTYRIATASNVVQASPTGTQTIDVSVRQQLTVNLARRTRDTIAAMLTLDSIAMTGAPGMMNVSGLIGASFTSLISPTGKFYSSSGPLGLDPQLGQIAEGIGRFVPVFNGAIAAGKRWSDTVSGTLQQNGVPVSRTSISAYEVMSDTSINGQWAFRIHRTTTVKATGSGLAQGGATIALETHGTSNGDFYVSHKGVYLGGNSRDDANIKIAIPSQRAEIRLTQTQRTVVEAIR